MQLIETAEAQTTCRCLGEAIDLDDSLLLDPQHMQFINS